MLINLLNTEYDHGNIPKEFTHITVNGQIPRQSIIYVLTSAVANVTSMFVDQLATFVFWIVTFS